MEWHKQVSTIVLNIVVGSTGAILFLICIYFLSYAIDLTIRQ